MKKLLSLFLLLCLLPCFALSESLWCSHCMEYHEVSYLQQGDIGIAVEGLTEALSRAGYLSESTGTFSAQVEIALRQFQANSGLPVTGQADPATLQTLLFGPSSPYDPDDATFWMPTSGGRRVHVRPCCSQMDAPRLITLEQALAMHIEPCTLCAKELREMIDWDPTSLPR